MTGILIERLITISVVGLLLSQISVITHSWANSLNLSSATMHVAQSLHLSKAIAKNRFRDSLVHITPTTILIDQRTNIPISNTIHMTGNIIDRLGFKASGSAISAGTLSIHNQTHSKKITIAPPYGFIREK